MVAKEKTEETADDVTATVAAATTGDKEKEKGKAS
jgi:hypothetical protein